jgi:hypothetical protein
MRERMGYGKSGVRSGIKDGCKSGGWLTLNFTSISHLLCWLAGSEGGSLAVSVLRPRQRIKASSKAVNYLDSEDYLHEAGTVPAIQNSHLNRRCTWWPWLSFFPAARHI